MTLFAKRYLERHNLEFRELKIEAEAELTTEASMRLTKIKAKVYTDADLGDRRKVFLRFRQIRGNIPAPRAYLLLLLTTKAKIRSQKRSPVALGDGVAGKKE